MKPMRRSRVLERLREGEIATCMKINLADARVVEIAALAGFDCVWPDLEHIANDLSVIEKMVWAAKAHDTDVLTRVPRGSYSDLVHPLELDSTGIMVPHVMDLEDAQRVVWQTRFHPLGRRALDGGNADGRYGFLPMDSYLADANDQRMLVLQIEDPEPMTYLDEIAALPGVDMLFFGPGDFSQGIGAPGVWDDPRLADARAQVAQAARRHGKFAGTVGSLNSADELISLGYSFISLGADVVGLGVYMAEAIAAFTPQTPADGCASVYTDGNPE